MTKLNELERQAIHAAIGTVNATLLNAGKMLNDDRATRIDGNGRTCSGKFPVASECTGRE